MKGAAPAQAARGLGLDDHEERTRAVLVLDEAVGKPLASALDRL
jgi:hypothetical protein